jgi:hypothetical protein
MCESVFNYLERLKTTVSNGYCSFIYVVYRFCLIRFITDSIKNDIFKNLKRH